MRCMGIDESKHFAVSDPTGEMGCPLSSSVNTVIVASFTHLYHPFSPEKFHDLC